MNARELHDRLAPFAFRGAEQWCLDASVGAGTILSALSLAAAVDESGEEVVRELRGQHCRDFGNDPQCDADGLCICAMHERAAALLVARSQEIERLKAKNEALRGHADGAIAEIAHHLGEGHPRVVAYRAAHPKPAPMTDEDRIAGLHANLQEKP